MASQSISLRIPREMRADIEAISRRTGRDFSGVAKEMLAEAIKMRRIPGIIFADSPSGRVAKVAGTGLGVFEIARDWRDMGGDWERLRQAYHWLTEHELRAAVAYAEAYPEEIEERLRADEYWTPERVWETYPFMRPRTR
jgi:uncharacterized protein (DUF433 family)